MNKKILIAISAIGVAAGFWACGSGPIEPPNLADDTLNAFLKNKGEIGDNDPFGLTPQISKSKELCAENLDCLEEMTKANGKALQMSSSEAPVSSEAAPQSSAIQPPTSSSSWVFSSMGPVGPGQSSSSSSIVSPVLSSSSEIQPVAGLGSCAPAKNIVELNEAVTWNFTVGQALKGNLTELMSIKYEWSFPDGSITTSADKSPKVSYSSSGTKTASLKVTVPSGTETIACSPSLRVNGQPITGCKCVATIESPDVAKGQAATWNLMGCTSKANITKYTWTNATADASGLEATAAVAEKNDVVTGVSVMVENDDSTAVVVNCPDAKAIDSRIPDYELKEQNTSIDLPAGKVTVTMNLPASWHNNETSGTCTFQCDGTNQQITVKAGGVSGTNYSVQLKIPISSTINGYALDVELSGDAKCKVGW